MLFFVVAVVELVSVPFKAGDSVIEYVKLFSYLRNAHGSSFIPKLSTARKNDEEDELFLEDESIALLDPFGVEERNALLLLACTLLFCLCAPNSLDEARVDVCKALDPSNGKVNELHLLCCVRDGGKTWRAWTSAGKVSRSTMFPATAKDKTASVGISDSEQEKMNRQNASLFIC